MAMGNGFKVYDVLTFEGMLFIFIIDSLKAQSFTIV